MASLNAIADETKALLKWGGIITGVGVVLFTVYFMVTFVLNLTKPPPPPTVGYGKLQKIEFPPEDNRKSFSYIIDTASGSLPKFDKKIKVFKTKPIEEDILARKKIQEKISSIGFYSEPFELTKFNYKWVDNKNFYREISFNIFTKDFSLRSSYLTNQFVLSAQNLNDLEQIKAKAADFLSGIESLPDDLKDNRETQLLQISNGALLPATSLSNAHQVNVYFYQKDVDEKQIFYPTAPFSTIRVAVTGGEYDIQIVEADYDHQSVVIDKFETYPIKTSQEAFDELSSDGGFIAKYNPDTKDEISIKDVKLGYYLGREKQQHLMPIYVFLGNDGFTAYVSAVKGEWIGN